MLPDLLNKSMPSDPPIMINLGSMPSEPPIKINPGGGGGMPQTL